MRCMKHVFLILAYCKYSLILWSTWLLVLICWSLIYPSLMCFSNEFIFVFSSIIIWLVIHLPVIYVCILWSLLWCFSSMLLLLFSHSIRTLLLCIFKGIKLFCIISNTIFDLGISLLSHHIIHQLYALLKLKVYG